MYVYRCMHTERQRNEGTRTRRRVGLMPEWRPERERKKDRQIDRQTDTDRQTQTDRELELEKFILQGLLFRFSKIKQNKNKQKTV